MLRGTWCLLALGACSFDGSTPLSSPSSPEDSDASHCSDGVVGEDEVDVDCGGLDCRPCVGSGDDGSITVSSRIDLNLDTLSPGRNCLDGGDAVAYSVLGLDTSSAQLSRSVADGCLAEGDEVLLINLQGTNITQNVGRYESLRVASVSADQVFFSHAKRWSYGEVGDSNIGIEAQQQRVMLQRVPNYSEVTIASEGTLSASPFDGLLGGVLALRASGLLDVQGSIDMSATGYRGGVAGGPGPETLSGVSEQGGGGGGGGSGGHDGAPDAACPMAMPGAGANGAQAGYCGQSGSSGFDPCPQAANVCGTNSCGGDGIDGGGGGGAGFGYDSGLGGAATRGGGKGGDKQGGVGQAGASASGGQAGGGGGGAAGRDSAGGGGGGRALVSFSNVSPDNLSVALFGGGAAAGAGGGGGGGAGDYYCAGGGSGGSAQGIGGAPGTDTCAAADAQEGLNGGSGGAGGGTILLYSQGLVVSGSGSIRAEGGTGGLGGAGGRGAEIGACGTGRGGGGGGGGGGADGAAGGNIWLWSYAADLGEGLVSASGGLGGGGGGGTVASNNSGSGGSGEAGSVGGDGNVTLTAIETSVGTSLPTLHERQP